MEARIRTALTLYAFGVVGLFLLVTPWTGVWTQAVVGLLPTKLGQWVLGGWVRGTISGLGALNLAVAFQVAIELWKAMHRAADTAAARELLHEKNGGLAAAAGEDGWEESTPWKEGR
ncbi:MAG TPA: hypothetical protein VD788_12235 [Candidatus Polarisedimenticolaceae bacterium]|nr:hypothetical protein [Candidatus Polarisedimenticolaceae bacterium]